METSEKRAEWRVRALRGATTVECNEAEAIHAATAELVSELMKVNNLETDDIISIIFTVTTDLNAAFPATGARQVGLGSVPLVCATEIPVPGSLGKCIRCLMHINTLLKQEEMQHLYLREAGQLRPDLVIKQS